MARRGPGLLGAAARTAVVAGTATAVSGRVRAHQADRAAEQQAAEQYEAQQRYLAQQEYQAQQSQPPPPPPSERVVDQLERLVRLRDQGVLTDAELAAQKARILGEG
ncbi:SHOCT domain-containing protein [Yinghuangia seranimata]|uniref:SHOCT domain-containing protein n=1 Tax=Yinghuangia seranimata TaxID=408067 RepID=UPI003CCFA21B